MSRDGVWKRVRVSARASVFLGLLGLLWAPGCSLLLGKLDAQQCDPEASSQCAGEALRGYICDPVQHVCVQQFTDASEAAGDATPDLGQAETLADECSTNLGCGTALGDGGSSGAAPAICTKTAPRRCARLENEDCTLATGTPDWANDNAVFVAGYENLNIGDGVGRLNSAELAFREINKITLGLPPTQPSFPRRPLVFLRCNYMSDADRASKHVVGLKDIQAVIPRGDSDSTLAIFNNYLLPNGIFTLATNVVSPVLTSIQDNGLLWRTRPSTAAGAPGQQKIVIDIEAQVRAELGLGSSERLRVALAHSDAAAAEGNANAISSALPGLTWNIGTGSPSTPASADYLPAKWTELSSSSALAAGKQVAAFKPHIVVVESIEEDSDLIRNVENSWGTDAGSFRPYYVLGPLAKDDENIANLVKNPSYVSVRSRIRALGFSEKNGTVYTDFATHYQAEFGSPPQTQFQYFYDAGYALAYAYAAAGNIAAVTGKYIAGGMGKLVSASPPTINVGPGASSGNINAAFTAVGIGEIDLNGASNKLDWDILTGDVRATSVAWTVFCYRGSPPLPVDTAQTWNPTTGNLDNTFSCPP